MEVSHLSPLPPQNPELLVPIIFFSCNLDALTPWGFRSEGDSLVNSESSRVVSTKEEVT